MPHSKRFILLLAGLLLVAAGALGQGLRVPVAHAQVGSDTFVGRLSGIDAFIGIVSDGNNVTADVCDGTNNALGDSFQGTIDQASDGVLMLQAADNNDVLSLNADATTWHGMLGLPFPSGGNPSIAVRRVRGR